MLLTEFTDERNALQYIDTNENEILKELEEREIKTMYTNGNIRVNVMKDGKRLIKAVIRFEGNKKISDIHRDMTDLRLL